MRTPAIALLLVLAACGERAPERPLTEEQVKAQVAQLRFEPGEWETRTQVTNISVPVPGVTADDLAAGRGAQVRRACLSAEQAANPDAGFLAGNAQGGCQAERLDMAGGRIDGRFRCNPPNLPGTAIAEVTGSYTRTAFRTDVKSKVDLNGLPDIGLDLVVSSRRVGDCATGDAKV